MKFIEKYIDEIIDSFPMNKVTKKIRSDLLVKCSKDYEHLLEQGMDQDNACECVLECIEEPNKIAEMIPNRHSNFYYILVGLLAMGMIYVLSFTSKPDFLQIFLPARFQFPDIIERFIQYVFIMLATFILSMEFYRLLPQKILSRSSLQENILLLIGTVMISFYFAISMAFVWLTFNGYGLGTHTTVFNMMRGFFNSIILSLPMTILYAIINALCFVLGRHLYHLNMKAQPYVFEAIYLPLAQEINFVSEEKQDVELEVLNETIEAVEVAPIEPKEDSKPMTKPVKPSLTKTLSTSYTKTMASLKDKLKRPKKVSEPIVEIATEVSIEPIHSKEIQENLPKPMVVEEDIKPSIRQRHKKRGKKSNIKIVNDLNQRQKKAAKKQPQQENETV